MSTSENELNSETPLGSTQTAPLGAANPQIMNFEQTAKIPATDAQIRMIDGLNGEILSASPESIKLKETSGHLTVPPEPVIERSVASEAPFKTRMKKWALECVSPVLTFLKITISYLAFLLGDVVVLWGIDKAFGSSLSQIVFIAYLLLGIKICSALGIAITYLLHLIRAIRVLEESSDTEGKR